MERKRPPLKPCPFCGGEPQAVQFGWLWHVQCKKCRTMTRGFKSYLTPEKKWNARQKEEEA